MIVARAFAFVTVFLSTAELVHGYIPSIPQETPLPYLKNTNPFKTAGLDVDLPDFQKIFSDIQMVSPLACSVITGENNRSEKKGFAALDDKAVGNLKWKKVESKKGSPIHKIDRLDNFNGKAAPMLRFRSSLRGPCVGEYFGKYIIIQEDREKWDAQIHTVDETHRISDLDSANIAMGFGRYGDCSRLGLGYCRTKASMGVTPREQLFLYGLQDFADGSCMIWGQEMDEKYNHLLPPGKRETRATSHLFAATMTPTSDETFDIEYAMQLDIGGNIPLWLTTPVVIDTVKSLFKTVQAEFATPSVELDAYLVEKAEKHSLSDRHSLLMTP